MILLKQLFQEEGRCMTFDDAKRKIESIADNVTNFKIGKTGQALRKRFSSEYDDLYDEILPICKSSDSDLVDKWEEKLIKHFKDDNEYKNKCDNEAEGGGTMEDSETYRIYVVTKS